MKKNRSIYILILTLIFDEAFSEIHYIEFFQMQVLHHILLAVVSNYKLYLPVLQILPEKIKYFVKQNNM